MDQQLQNQEIQYQVQTVKVDGKEYTLYEYKKELDQQENKKLVNFLEKLEAGLQEEEGMEGVRSICKDWKKEYQREQKELEQKEGSVQK